jgi:hypothetical protein
MTNHIQNRRCQGPGFEPSHMSGRSELEPTCLISAVSWLLQFALTTSRRRPVMEHRPILERDAFFS